MDQKMFLKKVKDMWSWSNGAVKKKKKKTVGKDSKCQANISWVALQQNSRADSALYDSCALNWQIKAISPLPFVAGTGNF